VSGDEPGHLARPQRPEKPARRAHDSETTIHGPQGQHRMLSRQSKLNKLLLIAYLLKPKTVLSYSQGYTVCEPAHALVENPS